MYYPFRSEKELRSGNPPTYANKLRESNVIELVDQKSFANWNTWNFCWWSALKIWFSVGNNLFGKQENEETYDQQSQHLEEADTDSCDADFREIEN